VKKWILWRMLIKSEEFALAVQQGWSFLTYILFKDDRLRNDVWSYSTEIPFLVNWNFTIGFVRSTVMCLSVLDKGMLNQTSLAKQQYSDLLIYWLFRLLYEQQCDIYQFSIRDSVDIIAQSYSKLIYWTKHGR